MRIKKLTPLSKATFFKSLSPICFFSLVFALFYIASYIYDNLYLNVYTERDIRTALNWLKGNFYLPEPEMHPKGSLPGPFFYFLLFPPLLFGGNIYSKLLIWRMVWLALSYTVAFHFVSKICKHKESLFIFLMFLISCIGPSLFTPIFFTFNPVFAIMFHILAVIALYTWKETDKNKYLYFLGLIIGFGAQVHILVLIHILTAFTLFLIKKKKPWKSMVWFIALILLPFLPYLGFYNLYAFEILKSIVNNSLTFYQTLFSLKLWFASFHAITSFKPYLAGPVLFLLLSLVYKIRFKKKPTLSFSSKNLLMIIAPPVCLLCLIGGHWWYLYSIPVMLMVLFTKFYDDLIPKRPNKKFNNLILCGVLFLLPLAGNVKDIWAVKMSLEQYIVIGLLLVLIYLIITIPKVNSIYLGKICVVLMISSLHLFSKDYERNISHYFSPSKTFPNNTYKDHWMNYYINSKYHFVKPFLKQMVLDTNWEADTATKRIYIIGAIHRHSSLYAHYTLAKEQLRNTQLRELTPQTHGYFVIGHLTRFTNYLQEDWKKYLSHSPYISPFVQKEIQTGKLLLQNPKLYNRYWLIPYKLTKASIFPEGFYNIGQPYYWEEPHWLKTCSSTKSFTRNNSDFYYCMVLPGHLQKAGVHITLSKETNKSFMEISFFGPVLGLKAETTLIDGYAYWSDIQISLFCDNKEIIHALPNIGYNPKSWMDLIALSALNSPLKLKFSITCEKEKISNINLKFKHWKKRLWNYSELTPKQKDITWNIL